MMPKPPMGVSSTERGASGSACPNGSNGTPPSRSTTLAPHPSDARDTDTSTSPDPGSYA